MLEDWIYKGQINDPYNEFMINEDKEIVKEKLKDDFNEKFWERKYSLIKQNTPKFLESIAEKILLTGKYLNAINETGKNLILISKDEERHGNERKFITNGNKGVINIPNAREIVFTIKEEIYKQIVDISYNFSSKVLLNLLLHDHKLIDRLRFIKRKKSILIR